MGACSYGWYSNCYGSNIHFTKMVEIYVASYQFYELWEIVGITILLEEVKLMQQLKHKCDNIGHFMLFPYWRHHVVDCV